MAIEQATIVLPSAGPPLVTSNANDERGFLGIAFHPGFASPTNPGYRTLYTYTSELISAGRSPT